MPLTVVRQRRHLRPGVSRHMRVVPRVPLPQVQVLLPRVQRAVVAHMAAMAKDYTTICQRHRRYRTHVHCQSPMRPQVPPPLCAARRHRPHGCDEAHKGMSK